MLDYVIRNARVPGAANGGAVDIGFAKGKIAAIEPRLVADSPSYDAQGCLCCGGLVETHIHLDKSRIIDRCTPEPSRDNPNHMKRVAAVKSGFSVEDIYNRAKITLENCIKQGTTRIRTHAEIDLPVGTKCIEALKMLQQEYAWAVDLEICAFAQEGLANVPEADKALVEAIEMGATSIGGAPNYDTDHPAHINRVFELAREYDIHVDLHIDSGHDPASMDNMLVAELTEQYKYGGRVAMGHMTKVAALPPDKQKDIARRLADATRWVNERADRIADKSHVRHLTVGYFGASTGGAAALVAAAELGARVGAVVSRGGRPDLAGEALGQVKSPTLLIVGGLDKTVIELNKSAYARLHCEKELKVVPNASHLFEEPGTLEEVARLAAEWFRRHLEHEDEEGG